MDSVFHLVWSSASHLVSHSIYASVLAPDWDLAQDSFMRSAVLTSVWDPYFEELPDLDRGLTLGLIYWYPF